MKSIFDPIEEPEEAKNTDKKDTDFLTDTDAGDEQPETIKSKDKDG